MEQTTMKRELAVKTSQSLQTKDFLLVGILLAVGAVLKIFSNTIIAGLPMKPNFIIAMYCLAILLIRPRFRDAMIIGVLAGCVCQFLPGNGTPYVNIASELIGATVMAALITIPFGSSKLSGILKPMCTTFLATLASGYSFFFILKLLLFMGLDINTKATLAFTIIIFGTAIVNCILVTFLYPDRKSVV